MRFLIATSTVLALAAMAGAQKPADAFHQVAGTWRYDVSTLKLEVNEQVKQEMRKAGKANEVNALLAAAKKTLSMQLATMKIVFGADKSIVIYGGKPVTHTNGSWLVKGRNVVVTMNNPAQTVPQMALAKDGRHILTTYSDPRFGKGTVLLVKH